MKNAIEYVVLVALIASFFCGCSKSLMNVEQESQAIWEVRLAVQKALRTENTDAMMELWAEDATFGEPNGGLWIGKDKIRQAHDKLFETFDITKIEFKRLAINFPTPDVAIEEVSYDFAATGFESHGRDTQVLVKRDGRWLITAVSDFVPPVPERDFSEQKKANTKDDIEAIRKREDEFLAAHAFNDGTKLAEFYTEDALLIPPDEPIVRGKQAIAEWYQKEFKKAPPIENPTVVLEEIDITGNVAFLRGIFTLKFENVSGTRVENLRFISIFQKQNDGAWLFHRDIWNTYVPLASMQ
ncbi:MAG: SgcJ/EcaC family oxidoreductase [Sedimentisphaerales bacterium]